MTGEVSKNSGQDFTAARTTLPAHSRKRSVLSRFSADVPTSVVRSNYS